MENKDDECVDLSMTALAQDASLTSTAVQISSTDEKSESGDEGSNSTTSCTDARKGVTSDSGDGDTNAAEDSVPMDGAGNNICPSTGSAGGSFRTHSFEHIKVSSGSEEPASRADEDLDSILDMSAKELMRHSNALSSEGRSIVGGLLHEVQKAKLSQPKRCMWTEQLSMVEELFVRLQSAFCFGLGRATAKCQRTESRARTPIRKVSRGCGTTPKDGKSLGVVVTSETEHMAKGSKKGKSQKKRDQRRFTDKPRVDDRLGKAKVAGGAKDDVPKENQGGKLRKSFAQVAAPKIPGASSGNVRSSQTQDAKSVKGGQAQRPSGSKASTAAKVGPQRQDTSDGWTEVRSKKMRKPKGGRSKTEPATKTTSRSVSAASASRPKEHVLLIYPLEATESEATHRLVAGRIDPVKAGISIRGIRHVSRGGILISAQGEKDLDLLSAELAKSGLESLVSVSRPDRRPSIILFGIEESLGLEQIIPALCSQNEVLYGAETSMKVDRTFNGKKGCNAVITLDRETLQRLKGSKMLSVGWRRVSFRVYNRLVLCGRCWLYGHSQAVCRGSPRCGNCGSHDHVRSACEAKASCPNCAHMNVKYHKNLDTGHPAGSEKCHVYQAENERVRRRYE